MSAVIRTSGSARRGTASSVSVAPVRTLRDRRRFLDLPWSVYNGNSHWIPPLRVFERELLGFSSHPFHENNTVQAFLASRDGRQCGRISAIHNRDHNRQHSEELGFWGFFESVDDPEVARRLFDAVREWFADRGIYRLRGPLSPSLNYTGGLLIDGFDAPPSFLMTYNLPYYAALVEEYGFIKSQDLYAYEGNVRLLEDLVQRYQSVLKQMITSLDLRFRTLDKSGFQADFVEFLSVYNRSLVKTWGFVPMSRAEIMNMASGLSRLLIPELVEGVEVKGQMIGATFCLPDYSPIIKAIRGRLWPLGFLRLLRAKRQISKVRLMSINVLPEYQRSGMGLVLLAHLLPSLKRMGIEEAEFSWVLESNHLSRGSLETGGARRIKTYRIYDFT